MRLIPSFYLVQVATSTTNDKADDEVSPLHVVMRHHYSSSARGHCASFVIVVTLHYKAVG
jgi:hypothetical protein